jgi:hypothetical protein
MMDTTSSRKQLFRIRMLALAVLVCAWLFPTSVGIASSNSDNLKVTLTVEDAVGVYFGRSALESASTSETDQVITEFVTRGASSGLAVGLALDAVHEDQIAGESEFVVTVSNL